MQWKIFIDKDWKHFEHYLTKNVFYFPKNDIWVENSKLVEYVDDPELWERSVDGQLDIFILE